MSPKRRQNNQGKKSVEPAQNAQEGTWVYVDKSSDSFFNVYKALQDWQRELIVRKWMKANKLFWGSEETLLNSFFVHMFALCRQPAGRADGKRGSQQCLFEMPLPHVMCLPMLGIGGAVGFEVHPSSRYTLDEEGQIKWLKCNTIDSYFMRDMNTMSNWVKFHSRAVTKNNNAYGSSKGVVVRQDGIRVMCTLIPPFIIEVCRRSHGRLVLAVTCNMFTFNDLEGLDLPPAFRYADGERQQFRQLALDNLKGMVDNGHEVSRRMQRMLPPAYRGDELEGEETSDLEVSEVLCHASGSACTVCYLHV